MNGEFDDVRWLALVRQQVAKTEFGVVQIVIHGSRVVRIERTEKLLVPRNNEDDAKTKDEL
jgi:hypothetical protein